MAGGCARRAGRAAASARSVICARPRTCSCDASGTGAVLRRDALGVHHRGMTRIEIELYADRLSRHAERLRDDLEGARMRLGWLRVEARGRARAGGGGCAALGGGG